MSSLDTAAARAALLADLGRPATMPDYYGRDLHIPRIVHTNGRYERCHGAAFPNEADAIAHAKAIIDRRRRDLARDLTRPGYDHLRSQHGLAPLDRSAA